MKIDNINDKLLTSLFETIPMELTVIDADDKVAGWNRHNNRHFYRPEACMEMNFRDCHPTKSLALVERIISEMKDGSRDNARFWIDLPVEKGSATTHKILIEFYALRDPQRAYLGCLECTMDVEDIMHLEGERRLMDEA
jgi:DUF438 domain-containing protein